MRLCVTLMAVSAVMHDVFSSYFLFFFNDTATTEIYTLSLHDALPILYQGEAVSLDDLLFKPNNSLVRQRSEEHTSELQSRLHLVCRLLLEKKKKHTTTNCPLLRSRASVPSSTPCSSIHAPATSSHVYS